LEGLPAYGAAEARKMPSTETSAEFVRETDQIPKILDAKIVRTASK
jgi:hypothetical protein